MLITYQLWAGSKDWKVVSEVGTRGELVNRRREDKDTVSMLEGAENVVSFKYSGLDGMQLDSVFHIRHSFPPRVSGTTSWSLPAPPTPSPGTSPRLALMLHHYN